MKKNDRGFMLIETLLVGLFVASTLIYLYIQFSNLSRSYSDSFKYNTVEGLYALRDIREYLVLNQDSIENEIFDNNYTLDPCSILPDEEYCRALIEKENIDTIIITYNEVANSNIPGDIDQNLLDFINRIEPVGQEEYRIIASFNNKTYATLRF